MLKWQFLNDTPQLHNLADSYSAVQITWINTKTTSENCEMWRPDQVRLGLGPEEFGFRNRASKHPRETLLFFADLAGFAAEPCERKLKWTTRMINMVLNTERISGTTKQAYSNHVKALRVFLSVKLIELAQSPTRESSKTIQNIFQWVSSQAYSLTGKTPKPPQGWWKSPWKLRSAPRRVQNLTCSTGPVKGAGLEMWIRKLVN